MLWKTPSAAPTTTLLDDPQAIGKISDTGAGAA